MDIAQLVVYGLIIGSIYALGAIGVSLTFGILRFANFSHGDLMTFGAYAALVVYSTLSLPMWLALPAGMVASAAMAVLIDRVLYRRLREVHPIILLIASFGMALILRSLVQLIWGPNNTVYQEGIQIAQRYWGLRIKTDQVVMVGLSFLMMLAVHLFLSRSKTGKAMRAVADSPYLARLAGIDTEKVILATWIVGGALAGAAGVFVGIDSRLQPDMGWFILLPIFAAAILGGIGNPYGAMVGGLVIGISQEVSTTVIEPSYKPAVAFAIMVVMLIVRPTGLFAGRS